MESLGSRIKNLQNTYNNYSLGDKVIANSTSNNSFKSNSLGNRIKKLQEQDIINKLPEIVGTNNVIPVDRNEDDSIKVTFDNIYEDNNLAEVAKDFYYFRDGETFDNNKNAIDYYINDRTWKQANTVSIGKEYSYITGKNLKQDQLQRYAYLTKYWDDLPNMFQEGGGTFGQRALRFGKNIFYAVADPINIIGVGVGGQVAKQAAKTAAKESVKNLTTKELKKQLLSGELGKIGEKAAFKAGTKGIFATASVDALALGGADVARQYTEMEVNPEQRYDPLRTGTVALTALGLSSTAQFAIAGGGALFKGIGKRSVADIEPTVTPTTTIKPKPELKPKPTEGKIDTRRNYWTFVKTNMFDAYDPVINLQRKITGVGGSVRDVKRAFEAGVDKSPMLLPYFQFRLTAASNARAEAMMKYGIYLPPNKNAKTASFSKGKSKGLISERNFKGEEYIDSILGKFEDADEVTPFLEFVAANHMRQILKNNKNFKEKIEVPWTNKQIQKAIDYGRLTPRQYYTKYRFDFPGISLQQYLNSVNRKSGTGARVNNFYVGMKELKVYTDDLLEYTRQSELKGDSDISNILNKYKNQWIPLTRQRDQKSIFEKFTNKKPNQDIDSTKLTITKSPIKGLSLEKQEGDLNFLKNIVQYSFRTVAAGDINRAKVSLYEMLEQAQNSGKFGTVISSTSAKKPVESGAIVRKISGADRIELIETTLKNVRETLEKNGLKIAKKRGKKKLTDKELEKIFKDEHIDVLTFSGQIKKSDTNNYVDIVYRRNAKGEVKAEFYEILDENMHQMYKNFDLKTGKYINTLDGQLTGLGFVAEAIGTVTRPTARFLGRAITYTPTFQARNFFRDTQAAAITSAFSLYNKGKVGFMPFLTSGKSWKDATFMNDNYRLSMINGLGYSTRFATEGFNEYTSALVKSNELDTFYNRQLKKLFGTKTKPGLIGSGAEAYKNFVAKTEYASRLGEFQLAKQAGFDDLGASFAGREVTTDFGMRGSSAILNSMSRNTMFLNASLQGMYRGTRVFTEGTSKERTKAFAVLAGVVLLPEVSLYYLNRNNETYNDIADVKKQLNHMIPFNFKTDERGNPVGTDFIAIPKPYDFGVLGNLTHALIKGIDTGSTAIGRKYLAQSLSLLLPVNFIGPIPAANTALEPILEMLINKDAFTGNEVFRQYDELKMSNLKVKSYTRDISIQISNLTEFLKQSIIPGSEDKFIEGMDPITIDFLINSYAVGVLKYGVDMLDQLIYTTTQQKKYGEKPTLRADEENIARNPLSIFTKAFVIESPLKSTKYYQIYRELVKEAKKISSADISKYGLEKGMRTWGNIEENIRKRMAEGKSPIPKEVSIYSMLNANYLNKVDQKLKQINKYISDIPYINMSIQAQRMGVSEGDYKRQMIDKHLQLRNDLLKTVINKIADMDLDYVFEDVFRSKTYVNKN